MILKKQLINIERDKVKISVQLQKLNFKVITNITTISYKRKARTFAATKYFILDNEENLEQGFRLLSNVRRNAMNIMKIPHQHL